MTFFMFFFFLMKWQGIDKFIQSKSLHTLCNIYVLKNGR